MIPRSLLLLMRLQGWAFLRRMFRGARGVRGVVVLVLGSLMLLGWVMSMLSSLLVHREGKPEWLVSNGGLVLLGIALVPPLAFGKTSLMVFTPAEVDMLFPGPYSRRQLMLFKMAKSASGLPLIAVFAGVWIRPHTAGLIQAYVGVLLAMLFVQISGNVVTLGGQVLGTRTFERVRGLALGIGVVAAAALIWFVTWSRPAEQFDAAATFAMARDSGLGRVIAWVPGIFIRAMRAESWGGLAGWGAAGIGVNALLILAALRLDRSFLENSALASVRTAAQLERFKRGGTLGAAGLSRGVQIPAPRIRPAGSFVGAATTIAHRQVQSCVRSWRGWLKFVVLAPVLFVVVSRTPGASATPLIVSMAVICAFVVPAIVRFDFRSDLASIEVLKAMPLRAGGVAIGEVFTSACVVVALACTAVLVGLGTGAVSTRLGAALIAGAIPAAVAFIALENVVFLLYPTTHLTGGLLDLQRVGRQALTGLVRMMLAGIIAGASGGSGWLAWRLTGSIPGGFIAGWVVGTIGAIAAVWGVARCYERYDVARDAPG